MIDTTTETLIPIRDVPKRLPKRPNGKSIHISAVYRWIQRGLRGVRLEAVRLGGSTYTTAEALQRFAEHLSAGTPIEPSIPVTSRVRQRQIETAAKQVDQLLGESTTKGA